MTWVMEISFDELQKEADPYQLFLNSLKAHDTRRKYKNALGTFLKLIPGKFYESVLNELPKCQEVGTLAKCFVELAKKDPAMANKIIAAYIKNEIELVNQGKLSANTLPNHIKPIKALLDSNGIPMHWKSLYKLYPRVSPAADDRAYTREELQKLLEVSPDITDKIIIQMFSSGGFRLEAWNYFTWRDVLFFQNLDGSYKGAALLVYRGDPESYWTFLTPECCKTLANYREIWKSQIGRYPKPDEPLLKAVKFVAVRRLNAFGVKRRVDKIVKKIGLRPPLPLGKKRHDVQLDHGFRKYFNTMLRRAKVDYVDKEDMMGHSVGLEKHYERYQEEDFERFAEYQKAIPFLTISDEERLAIRNKQLEEELTKQDLLEKEIKQLRQDIEILRKYVRVS